MAVRTRSRQRVRRKYSDSASLVHLVRPVADFQASAGETGWIRIVADTGAYNTTEHVIELAGGITLVDGLNRQFHTDAMRIDLRSGTLTSDRQVRGGLPDGEITSQGIRITDRRQACCLYREDQSDLQVGRPGGGAMSGLGRIPVLIVASASIALWALAGAAQQAGQQQNGQRQALPIMVEADQGIEWIAEEKLYVARGNAVATRGDIRVSGETLSAVYREVEDGSPEFYQVEVTDNVVVTAPGRTLYGDRAVYDLDQAVVVMLGSDVRADLGCGEDHGAGQPRVLGGSPDRGCTRQRTGGPRRPGTAVRHADDALRSVR